MVIDYTVLEKCRHCTFGIQKLLLGQEYIIVDGYKYVTGIFLISQMYIPTFV